MVCPWRVTATGVLDAMNSAMPARNSRIPTLVASIIFPLNSNTYCGFPCTQNRKKRIFSRSSPWPNPCSRLELFPNGPKAAQHYGAILAALEKLGQPIGVGDQHIAGHAGSEGLVLVMNNTLEFVHGPGLEVENWG